MCGVQQPGSVERSSAQAAGPGHAGAPHEGRRRGIRPPSVAAVATFLAVAGAVAFVFYELHPSLLFANTTTAGGDTGAHVALPLYIRQHLLNHHRLTGWDPQWYDGFPVFTFYFPLPSLAVALASYVIPYNIAFKLMTAAGPLSLPVAAWAMARLARMRNPIPACLAAATVPYLFEQAWTIDGGNIASTLAGEYAFAISLSLALVFIGLVVRGLETRRHKALAALLFAATLLCHLLPAVFAAVTTLIIVVSRRGWRRWWWAATTGVVGLALTAWWWLPFLGEIAYTTDMGYQKVTDYLPLLFASSRWWVLALAVAGVITTSAWRERMAAVVLTTTVVFSLVFVFDPLTKLYNARFLPFAVLGEYLMAGIGFAGLATGLGHLWRRWRAGLPLFGVTGITWLDKITGAGAASAVADAAGGVPHDDPVLALAREGDHPAAAHEEGARWTRHEVVLKRRLAAHGEHVKPPGLAAIPVVAAVLAVAVVLPAVTVLPAWTHLRPAQDNVPGWATWNYSGYQGKQAWPEYHALMTTMARVGKEDGCGRVMWEYNYQALDRFGTPMSLMLLPYWTGDCMDSMEGLLFESSATTPYHFINQAEMSASPDYAMAGLPYGGLDVTLGIQHLQLLGVRYFMACSPVVQQEASSDPAARLVAVSGPWKVGGGGCVSGAATETWKVYEIADAATVAPLANRPVVATGVGPGARGWLHASVTWYDNPRDWPVVEAASGPSSWARVPARLAVAGTLPAKPLPRVRVTHIRETSASISFHVDKTGVPVVVRTSYFPNWQVEGAQGPWRATPNLMIVVPTAHRVVLTYGSNVYDQVGALITIAGVVAAIAIAVAERRSRVARPALRRAAGGDGPTGGLPGGEPPSPIGRRSPWDPGPAAPDE